MKISAQGYVTIYVAEDITIDDEELVGMTEDAKLEYLDAKVHLWIAEQAHRLESDEYGDISYKIEKE